MRRGPGGGWECALCKLQGNTASSRRSLRSKQCKGEITLQCHPSHTLCWKEGFLWCDECAAYTTRQPRQLRLPCPGKAAGDTRRNILRRLREGLPPTTANYAASHKAHHRDAEDEEALMHWINTDTRPDQAHGGRHRPTGEEAEQPAARVRRRTARSLPPMACGDTHSRAGRRAASADRRISRAAAKRGPRSTTTPSSIQTGANADALPVPRASHSPSTQTYRAEPGNEPAVTAAASAIAPVSVDPLCNPHPGEAWTRRLLPGAGMELIACSICTTATRTRCRGCHRPTCWHCARARISCAATSSTAR